MFGLLYQGIYNLPKIQRNAQNVFILCPNFGHIMVTFWAEFQNTLSAKKAVDLGFFGHMYFSSSNVSVELYGNDQTRPKYIYLKFEQNQVPSISPILMHYLPMPISP